MSVQRVERKAVSVVWRVRWRQGGRTRSKVLGRKRDWTQVRVASDIEIYFCAPHAPGSARPTRTPRACCQYFPKGTDLSVTAPSTLTGSPLHDRPGKRLAFSKQIEEIGPLLLR